MAKLTLEEIGRMAGVSRSTVSRVVNRERSVSPEVRDRVLEVIARTGYRPNAAARSLASSRTGVIGLVIPHRVHTLFADPYFPRLIQGVSAACNAADTTLALYIFQTEQEEAALYPRVAAEGTVDGIVITATRMGDPLVERLRGGPVPFVVVGRPDRDASTPHVDVDNLGGARMVAHHLCDLGHERIGFITAPSSTTTGVDRRTGFLSGLVDRGRDPSDVLLQEGDYTEESGYRAMRELIGARPDAVFVATDTMALGALRSLRESDLKVPDDIALVGFDGLPPSELSDPPLTTVRQPVAETGSRAVELLTAMIHGELEGDPRVILPVELVVRGSCGATTSPVTPASSADPGTA